LAFITLISDYGIGSQYTAALKGTVYRLMPDAIITDISHTIRPHDVLQTAFLLKDVAAHFPSGTVHIISVDSNLDLYKQLIIARWMDQYFIGADNGVFSLLFDEGEAEIFVVKNEWIKNNDFFPDKNIFIPLAVRLLKGENLEKFADQGNINTHKQYLTAVQEEDKIRGSIVFIDGYENAITNIDKQLFYQKLENKNAFAIFYSRRNKITSISSHYHEVKTGSELALFNEQGFLEIAMNKGNAKQLLGLQLGGQIIIEFYD
jgi:S-adenosylmethionine hydrolase